MSKSTPTPWNVGALPPAGWRYICDANGETVAAVAEWNENGDLHMEFPNAKANASLIVRAVNSHADLLSALKALAVDANRLCDRNLGGTYEDDCRASITAARAAIAKASQ